MHPGTVWSNLQGTGCKKTAWLPGTNYALVSPHTRGFERGRLLYYYRHVRDQDRMINSFSLLILPQARIECIAQSLSDKIITEHGDEYGKAGEQRKPPRNSDIVLAGR